MPYSMRPSSLYLLVVKIWKSHRTFTKLDSVIHSSTGCESEVYRRLRRDWSAMNSLDKGVWHYRYLCNKIKIRVFFRGWAGTSHLHISVPPTTLLVNVASPTTEDPCHRIPFYPDQKGWTMPRGRPRTWWLRQVEVYMVDMA